MTRVLVLGALTVGLAACARLPTPQQANDAVLRLQQYDSWAWGVGIALIWADLVLPIPQTPAITGLGITFTEFVIGLSQSSLLLALVLGIGLRQMAKVDAQLETMTAHTLQQTELLGKLQGAIDLRAIGARNLVLVREPAAQQAELERIGKAQAALTDAMIASRGWQTSSARTPSA